MTEPQRICLFGGSFDPIHTGHLQIAKAAVEEYNLDQLIFIPCAQSPLKERTTRADGQQRTEMLKLATADLPWARVDELELTRPAPSYSWQTAETFRERFPEATLFWLLGTDQWNQLHRWVEYERLCRELTFIIYTRGDDVLIQRPEAKSSVITGQHPASSTALRQDIQGDSARSWLPPAVYTYISNSGLYEKDSTHPDGQRR